MSPVLDSPVAELRNFGNLSPMPEILTLSERGTLTVPAKLRRQLGLGPDQVLVAEMTPDGLLLRPHRVVPLVEAGKARSRLRRQDLAKARAIPTATIRAWVRRDEAEMADLRKSRAKRRC